MHKCKVKLGPGLWAVLKKRPRGLWQVVVLDRNKGGRDTKIAITAPLTVKRLERFYA